MLYRLKTGQFYSLLAGICLLIATMISPPSLANPLLVDDINKSTQTHSHLTTIFRTDDLINGKTIFTTNQPGLFTYNGTSTEKIYDTSITDIKIIGNTGYFVDYKTLFKTDGTPAGTVPLFTSDYLGYVRETIQLGSEAIIVTSPYGKKQKLWKTDGTPAGTELLKTFDYIHTGLVLYHGELFFAADDGTTGSEFWKTDGTTAGTVLVKDIRPDLGQGSGSRPRGLTVYNNQLLFGAHAGQDIGRELWTSDGTTAGTQVFLDIKPGGNSSDPAYFIEFNNALYFTVFNTARGDYSLWKTDGSASGTVKTVDSLGEGRPPFFEYNNELYYTGYNQTIGDELWKTDGTESGTMLVKDINPGTGSSTPSHFTIVDQTLFFIADDGTHGSELWKTDGTSTGTILVKDIRPGNKDSFPKYRQRYDDWDNLAITAFNHELYFLARTAWNDYGIWKSDGTQQGTVFVKDVTAGHYTTEAETDPADFTIINNELHFVASRIDANGDTREGFWKTNAANNTELVVDTRLIPTGSSNPQDLIEHNGKTLFFANDGSKWQLRSTDGSSSVPITDQGFRSVGDLMEWNGSLYFDASTLENDESHYWKTDGTAAGTVQLTPGGISVVSRLADMNGAFYFFTKDTSSNSRALWKSNGTRSGTMKVKDGFVATSRTSIVNGNTLFFTANDGISGMELWKTNGTTATTVLVKDIRQGQDGNGNPRSSVPNQFQVVGSNLFFTAEKPSYQYNLYKTDGSAAGTVKVLPNVIGDRRFVGDRYYFTQATDTAGTELWSYDSVTNVTALVKDINPGSGLSNPKIIGELNGELLFYATDNANGGAIWKTNGTEMGTVVIKKNILFYTDIKTLATTGNTLYFYSPFAASGASIWQTDGTAAGTRTIQDVEPAHPTNNSSWRYITDAVVVNGDIYFTAEEYSSGTGHELWKINGADSTAVLVADLRSGSLSGVQSILDVVGNSIYLSADNGITGNELWRYSVATTPGTAAFGDFVWNDLNGDGIQDASETGIPGISIELQSCSGQAINTTTTANNGSYSFANLAPGSYRMQFSLPAGHLFSPEKAAGNYRLDSNVNVNTGITQCYSMAMAQERLSVDVGMMPEPPVGGNPSMTLAVSANGASTRKPGPVLSTGSTVNWTYTVANTGGTVLNNIYIRGRQKVPVFGSWTTLCSIGTIQPGTTGSCSTSDAAVSGNYKSLIVARASSSDGVNLESIVPAFYKGEAGTPPPAGNDVVTLKNAIYFTGSKKLWIRAQSDASPAGSAIIKASVIVNGVEQDLGTIGWKADKGFYQQVFFDIATVPSSITLSSDQGGSVSGGVQVK
ncbi:MAG: ELWxxDGT repeat protein [Gammaproteobacteria bacterium]